MKKNLLVFFFCLNQYISAQNTLIIQPNSTNGKDVYLASGAGAVNYGHHPDFAASASTCNGAPCNARGLIHFNFSGVPIGSTITSAKLSLYADVPYNNHGIAMSGSNNSSVLQRVLSPWNADSVTWNTQPSVTTQNQVFLPTSISANQNYTDIDVTSLVQDMLPNNYGFLLKLQDEAAYNFMQFASSNYPDSTLHPKLVITYTTTKCLVLQPGINGKDAYLASGAGTNNYGHHPDFAASAGTCSGNPCNARGLIQFDLSSIPANATIYNARLSLYADVPYNNNGIAMSGTNNAALLQRVTGPWDENGVTWNTQPATTSQNEVFLPTSTSQNQNYLDLNVTQLINDMAGKNYGFMLRLQNEQYYNFMQFASGDYPDSSLHPKLSVCYSLVSQVPSIIARYSYVSDSLQNSIRFSDNSTGPVGFHRWDFGDGTYSTLPNPTHQFKLSGGYWVALTITDSTKIGVQDFYKAFVQVGVSGCSVKSYFTYRIANTQDTVRFQDNSYGNANKWYWNFGDGGFSTAKNPFHVFFKAGKYNICLSVEDSTINSCQNMSCQYLVLSSVQPCQAGYTYVSSGLKVSFANKSTGGANQWYWDFGDGSYSVAENPIYTYAVGGSYLVKMYAYNSTNGCSSNQFDNVFVGNQEVCQSNFTFFPSGLSVSFADQSIGNITNWYWDFGDGSITNVQNPTHVYSRPENYRVTLTIRNAASGSQSTYTNNVMAGNTDCHSEFTFFNDPLKNAILFKDLSASTTTNWYWSFGDGNFSKEQHPSHIYTYKGNYTVSLATYNGNGCVDFSNQQVKVGLDSSNCAAAFECLASGLQANFKNTSLGSLSGYYWNFGDDSYATQANPSHTYNKEGYYTVSLTIYNADGCFTSTYKTIVIGTTATNIDAKANFDCLVNDSTYMVSFSDLSYGNPTKWLWKFSDSTSSTLQHPTHTFKAPGFYEVCLTITANGKVKNFSSVIGIGQKGIKANFAYKDSIYYCKNNATFPMFFYGSAFGTPSKWKWSFGDGSFDSLSVNPSHIYLNAGIYNCCLTVSNATSKLTNTTCSKIKVGSSLTGLEASQNRALFQVFPNPLRNEGVLLYTLENTSNVEINIFNLQGQKMKTVLNDQQGAGIQRIILDASVLDMADGVYVIDVNVGSESFKRLVAVQK